MCPLSMAAQPRVPYQSMSRRTRPAWLSTSVESTHWSIAPTSVERPKSGVLDSLSARLSESAGVDDPKWPAVEEVRRGLLERADLRRVVASSDLLVREDQCILSSSVGVGGDDGG